MNALTLMRRFACVSSLALYCCRASRRGAMALLFGLVTLGFAPHACAQVPGAPSGLIAIPGNNQVTLYWTAPSGTVTSYNVYLGVTAGGEVLTPIQTGLTANTYTSTGCINGITYYYKVAAVNGSGTGSKSSEVSATPNAAPGVPTGLSAAAKGAAVSLTWTAPTGTPAAATYNLYRSTSSGTEGNSAPYKTALTSASYSDSGLTPGTTYFYKIASVASTGSQSNLSAETSVLVLPAPASLTASPGNAAISLSWPAVTGAASYSLYRGTATGGEGTTPYKTGLTTTSTQDTGLTNGNPYYYTVTAVATRTESAPSSEANATPVAPPTNLSATAVSSSQINLSWSASAGAVSYKVERNPNGNSGWTSIAAPTALSYQDTALSVGTTYFYRVSATNASGTSLPSTNVSAITFPAAPTNLTATATATQISLTWTASTGAASYTVKRGTVSGGPYTTISTAGAVTGTTYADTSVTSGTTYFYVVSAVNASGSSPQSNEAGATFILLAAPTNLMAQAGSQQVALSWTASSGATGYTVKQATTSGGPYTNATNPGVLTSTSWTVKYLTNETTYYFVITAVNNAGESANSNEVSAVPFGPPPGGPASLTAVPGAGQVSLSWAVPSGLVRGYTVQRATTTGGPYTTLATGSTTSYTDTAVTNGIPYFYVVSAYNTGGSGPASDEAMAQPFVSPAAPSVTPSYGYSSDGMRAWKTVSGSTTYFLYDGSQPVCELDGSGNVLATNTWGGSLLSRRAGSASTFYTFDPSGNLAQRLDASANVLGAYAFDAFGLRTGTDNTADPYTGFGGGYGYYADAETGLSLLGHRYYDTGTGRFVTRDPIGYEGGINLYSYTENNPTNEIDPDGTDGYFQDVGQVFAGYGDVLNPLNWAKGVAQISQIAGADGFGAAGSALGQGIWHGLTDWTSTSDPRQFGQSFGTTLLTVAPGLKRIPNPTALSLEGPWLTPEGGPITGATLLKVSVGGIQKCRIDVGRLPNKANIPPMFRNKLMPHYHRAVNDPATGQPFAGQGVGRHRPWQNGPGSRF